MGCSTASERSASAPAPLNYVGTSEHSYAKQTPFRRLVHTGNAFETIYFGSREEADKVLAYVEKLHQRVVGRLPEDAGAIPRGTPYSALDPELMLWTVAVIAVIAVVADSAQFFFELFVRQLSPGERDGVWEDYVRFAQLLGCRARPRRPLMRSSAAGGGAGWPARTCS